MSFELAHKFTHKAEGGYVNHPKDPGGPTNLGVSFRWLKSIGIEGGGDVDLDGDIDIDDIKALTPGLASGLFKVHFWDAYRMSEYPEFVGICMYDFTINAGPIQPVKVLQESLQFYSCPFGTILIDGKAGPKTRECAKFVASNSQKDFTLALRMLAHRQRWYDNLVFNSPDKFKDFHAGWTNRVSSLRGYLYDLYNKG